MRPFEQHNPPGMSHPLVEPWAAAQLTPTAELYRAAARDSAARVRPGQPHFPPKGELLSVGQTTRRRMRKAFAAVQQAAVDVRRLGHELIRAVSKGESTEVVEALAEEEKAAKAIVHRAAAACIPRRRRRAAWREARKGRSAEDWRKIWTDHVARAAQGVA
jgi:hypothetical protein